MPEFTRLQVPFRCGQHGSLQFEKVVLGAFGDLTGKLSFRFCSLDTVDHEHVRVDAQRLLCEPHVPGILVIRFTALIEFVTQGTGGLVVDNANDLRVLVNEDAVDGPVVNYFN